jgi:hypothetical protein
MLAMWQLNIAVVDGSFCGDPAHHVFLYFANAAAADAFLSTVAVPPAEADLQVKDGVRYVGDIPLRKTLYGRILNLHRHDDAEDEEFGADGEEEFYEDEDEFYEDEEEEREADEDEECEADHQHDEPELCWKFRWKRARESRVVDNKLVQVFGEGAGPMEVSIGVPYRDVPAVQELLEKALAAMPASGQS